MHHSSHKPLTDKQLAEIAEIGAEGMSGQGRLTGEICLDGHKVLLITAHKGTRSQVSFLLDIPENKGKHLEGQQVTVSGLLHKTTPWVGSISHTTLVGRPAEHHMPGEHVTLSGKIDNRRLMGPGGEAPPSGSYLVLTKPIRVGSVAVRELYLEGKELEQDKAFMLYGRLEARSWGGVETGAHNYTALSGISDVGAGEPLFDGVQFLSARTGTHLRSFIVRRNDIFDAPNAIVVLDTALAKGFLGSMGGRMVPSFNPFHGFNASTPITEPTDAERAAIVFNKEGTPIVVATGHELLKVGEETPPAGTADMFTYTWYFDNEATTLYTFVTGGIAGFVNRMSAVVQFGASS